MKKIIYLSVLCSFLTTTVFAQYSKQVRDSIYNASKEDHQLMMKELGIKELRAGPSGDPKAPDAANSDESKAKTYTSLPDPLTFNDGKKVTTPAEWVKRRKEIKEYFDKDVYGRMPADVPSVKWERCQSEGYYDWKPAGSCKRACGPC